MSHSMTSINQFKTPLRQDTDGRWIHVMETISYLTNLILVYDEIQSLPELFLLTAGQRSNPLRHPRFGVSEV